MSSSTLDRTAVIDRETGELVGEKIVQTQVIRATDEPDYVKLYVRAWCAFKGLDRLRDSDKDVLLNLLPVMTYAEQGQIIYTNSTLRKTIAEKLELKTIDNALTRLVKSGVLKRVARGTFAVNPELVGKGTWHDIKQLKATFNVIGTGAGTVTVETDRDE